MMTEGAAILRLREAITRGTGYPREAIQAWLQGLYTDQEAADRCIETAVRCEAGKSANVGPAHR